MTNTLEKAIITEAEKHNGTIKTSQIEGIGVPRRVIRDLVDKGTLVRESRGIYTVPAIAPDEYAVIQKRTDKLIFSYGTALFFHGISDRVPHIIDVTVPQGYNASRIKNTCDNLRFHYVKPELLSVGAVEILTPQGSKVTAYNKERCICDLIKDRNRIDKQVFTQAIREFFTSEYKPRDILKTARLIGVESEVRKYMEVL